MNSTGLPSGAQVHFRQWRIEWRHKPSSPDYDGAWHPVTGGLFDSFDDANKSLKWIAAACPHLSSDFDHRAVYRGVNNG